MNREELIKTLEVVKPGLASKDIVEHTTSFIFTNQGVLTYNDRVSVRAPLNMGFEGAVPADPILAFLKRVKGTEVKVNPKESELRLSCGRSRVGIPLYPEVPEHLSRLSIPKKGWTTLPPNFMEAIKFCSFSASRDMTQGSITNIHIFQNIMESTDRRRATRMSLDGDMGGNAILLPVDAASHLPGKDLVTWNVSKGWMHFGTAKKKGTENVVISCRTDTGEFPHKQLTNSFDGSGGKKVQFPGRLAGVLERAGVFAIADFDSDRKVSILCDDKKMTVRAEGVYGWFEETLKTDMPDMEFTIHPDFLKDILQHTRKARMLKGTILFKGKEFLHIATFRQDG